jgi:hypothetical protein
MHRDWIAKRHFFDGFSVAADHAEQLPPRRMQPPLIAGERVGDNLQIDEIVD